MRLPDGKGFPRWEQKLHFTKTYYVDNTSPAADDHGPGDQARPFRSIAKAAEVLQPGERVVIAAGIYRECLRPARGGTGPDAMISYEAAPGAQVILKGSDVLRDGWTEEKVSFAFRFPGAANAPGPEVTVWRHALSGALFPDGYNPFALPSIMGQWEWLDPKTTDMGPYLRRRGLVFADGKPLEPMEQLRELAMPSLPPVPDFTKAPEPQNGLPARRRGGPLMQEIGGVPEARFWTDYAGTALYVRLASGTPAEHHIEITTRQNTLLPQKSGLGFIRVKGLTFQHAGNAYPYPQFGMISFAGGDHWIFEDNTIEWANGMGLSIGFDGNSAGTAKAGASHILRRNTIRFCGVEGIGGMGTTDTLIEDNLIEWCGFADAERGWEAAGAKFHRARNMLFRRNVVRHIRHGNAAWWDFGNTNCRITSNIFADVVTVSAALHMEMNREPNTIDNNIIWDVRNAEPGTPGQRGCAGSGIFDNASDNLLITQNLIGRCENAGIFAISRPDRKNSGTGVGNSVTNNIFADCGRAGIVFLAPENKAEGNLYSGLPPQFQGFGEGAALRFLDWNAWRGRGWDKTSVMADLTIRFDSENLTLSIAAKQSLPLMPVSGAIGPDLLGNATVAKRPPGPIADLGRKRQWHIDPRQR